MNMRTMMAVLIITGGALSTVPASADDDGFSNDKYWAWKDMAGLSSRGQFGYRARVNLKAGMLSMIGLAGSDMERWSSIASLAEGLQSNRYGGNAVLSAVESDANARLQQVTGISKDAFTELLKKGGEVVGLKDTDYWSKGEVMASLDKVSSEASPAYGKRIGVSAMSSKTHGGRGNQSFDGGRVVISHTAVAPRRIFNRVDEHMMELSLGQLLKEQGVKDTGRRALLFGTGTDVGKNKHDKVAMVFEPTSGLGVRLATPKEGWKDLQQVRVQQVRVQPKAKSQRKARLRTRTGPRRK